LLKCISPAAAATNICDEHIDLLVFSNHSFFRLAGFVGIFDDINDRASNWRSVVALRDVLVADDITAAVGQKKLAFGRVQDLRHSAFVEGMSTLRYAGKPDWTSNDSTEHINLGCQQRIADATEKMAAATEKMAILHDKLIRDLAWYKEQYNNARVTLQYQGRSHSSLKGQITKLRNKIQVMAQPNEWTEQDALLELIHLKFQSNDIPVEHITLTKEELKSVFPGWLK